MTRNRNQLNVPILKSVLSLKWYPNPKEGNVYNNEWSNLVIKDIDCTFDKKRGCLHHILTSKQ